MVTGGVIYERDLAKSQPIVDGPEVASESIDEDEYEDYEDAFEQEVGVVDETLQPNVDEKILEGIEQVRDYYGQSKKKKVNTCPKGEEGVGGVGHEEDTAIEISGSEDDGDYLGLDNLDVVSFDEEELVDETVELRRRLDRFERFVEGRLVEFNIGLIFKGH